MQHVREEMQIADKLTLRATISIADFLSSDLHKAHTVAVMHRKVLLQSVQIVILVFESENKSGNKMQFGGVLYTNPNLKRLTLFFPSVSHRKILKLDTPSHSLCQRNQKTTASIETHQVKTSIFHAVSIK